MIVDDKGDIVAFPVVVVDPASGEKTQAVPQEWAHQCVYDDSIAVIDHTVTYGSTPFGATFDWVLTQIEVAVEIATAAVAGYFPFRIYDNDGGGSTEILSGRIWIPAAVSQGGERISVSLVPPWRNLGFPRCGEPSAVVVKLDGVTDPTEAFMVRLRGYHL